MKIKRKDRSMGANQITGLNGTYFAGTVPENIKEQANNGNVQIIPFGNQGYLVVPKEITRTIGLDVERAGDTRQDDVNVNTATSTTVDLSGYDKDFIAILQNQGLISTTDADFKKCTVSAGQEAKLNAAIGEYNSLPEKMDEVVFSGDKSIQDKLKAQLKEQGIIDDEGNIINKSEFAKLCTEGITVDGKTFKFNKEKDGQIDINYNDVTTSKVDSQFKEMNPAAIEKMKAQGGSWKEQLKELEKSGVVSIIDGRYFTNDPRLQKPQTEEVQNAEFDPVTLVGNDEAIDKRETKLQEDFLSLYDTNPDNAMDTLLHTKYYKQYTALEDALRKMNTEDNSNVKKKDYGNEVAYRRKGTLARAYYAQAQDTKGNVVYEYASPEEIEKFQQKVNKHKDDLSKLNNIQQIDEYKTFFGDVLDDNIDSLSDVQFQQLAEAKAYNEGLTDSQIKHMASTQFKNRFNTEMNNVAQDYYQQIQEAEAKGNTKKAEKLRRKMNEKLQEISNEKTRTENEDRGDYAAMMARGMVNSEIAEGNFKKTNPTYESIIEACPEAAKFIEANKQRFYKKDANGNLTNEFDPQAWKNFWLNKSASREDNNTDVDNNRIQDYFMSLGEAQDIVRGNALGNADEAYIGLDAIFRDEKENKLINIARDMAETAGVVTEANRTAGIRAAHVFKEMGKGVAAGAAADVLGNFVLSKIRIPYAGEVAGTVTGSVNWAQSGTIQDLDRFVSETYENGRLIDSQVTEVIEEHPWSCSGSENYSQDYTKAYSGSKKLRSFALDPWALGIGGLGGAIKGLIEMRGKHDMEDKNSRLQQYARRDHNEGPKTQETINQRTQQADVYKYTANVELATEPVDKEIANKKCRLRAIPKVINGKRYNMTDSKKDMVARYYGLAQNDPNFNKLYEYIMEDINGLKKGKYNDTQYVTNMTYLLPELLPGALTGLNVDYELKFDPETNPQELDDVPVLQGGTSIPNGENRTQRLQTPGESGSGSVTAHKRRKEV